MPRQWRFVLPNIALHIVQRGHNRRDCFRDESDYLAYLSGLRELSAKLACSVHAYCLMTNHVHLLVSPPSRDACISLMKSLGQGYAQYVNRSYSRTGSVWEGRFRSCIVESASYVLACYRYVELNPVRAGMVDAPAGYRWSSHRENVGAYKGFVSPHPEFLSLGNHPASRHEAYKGLFETGLSAGTLLEIRTSTNAGYPLASESFKGRIVASEKRVKLAPGRGGRPAKEDLERAPDEQGSLLPETGV